MKYTPKKKHLTAADIPEIEELAKTLDVYQLAERLERHPKTVYNFCDRYNINVKRKKYTVTQAVLDARRKYFDKKRKGIAAEKARFKSSDGIQERIAALKAVASGNILCIPWTKK